jgi:hypothetical protein
MAQLGAAGAALARNRLGSSGNSVQPMKFRNASRLSLTVTRLAYTQSLAQHFRPVGAASFHDKKHALAAILSVTVEQHLRRVPRDSTISIIFNRLIRCPQAG